MKPFRDHEDLVGRLMDLGMRIEDPDAAARYLRQVGYHRLGGYRYVFRRMLPESERDYRHRRLRRDEYASGADLRSVQHLERWDAELRQLCEVATGEFEIRLRAALAHVLARREPYLSFHTSAHLDTEACKKRTKRAHNSRGPTALEAWRRTVEKAVEQAKTEDFVIHHRHTYPKTPLPIWSLVDLLSLGALPYLLDLLLVEDLNEVARCFGLRDGKVLSAWARSIADLRNVCAHHSRLFNRSLKRAVAVRRSAIAESELLEHLMPTPGGPSPNQADQKRLYPTVAVLAYLLTTHESGSAWPAQLALHARQFPARCFADHEAPPITLQVSCGFPEGWDSLTLWATHDTAARGRHTFR